MKTTARRAARFLALAVAVLLIAFSAALLLQPAAHAETGTRAQTEPPDSEEPWEEGNGAGTILLGIVVFFGGGAFIGWAIWHHVKYTVNGTVERVKILKGAVADAKEEIKIANERKKNGEGWTLPPDYVRKNAGSGEEIVFGYGGPPGAVPPGAAPQAMSAAPPKAEAVFGYTPEKVTQDQKASAKKTVIAGILVLALGCVFVLGGALGARTRAKVMAYPTAQAKVLDCRAVVKEDDDGDEYVDHYLLDIQYAVDGKTYTKTGMHSVKEKTVVTIYYNPEEPGEAYSEGTAKDNEGNVVAYVLGGLVGLVGLLLIVKEKQKPRKLREGT